MDAANPHIKRGHPIFHGLFVFIALIEGIMSSYLVSYYNMNYDNGISPVRFIIFVSWWTFVLSILFLCGGLFSLPLFGTIGAELGYVFLTWIFWMSGAGAVTHLLGGGLDCNAFDAPPKCTTLNAVEAFGWIEFILFTVWLAALVAIGFMRHRSGGAGVWGGSIA